MMPKLLFPYIEKKYAATLTSKEQSNWGRTLINPDAFYVKTKGKGVKVCVIDTGASKMHPDLKDQVEDVFNPYEQEFPHDQVGHSSHVQGIIAAIDNGKGVIGIAPEAKLLVAKGISDDGFGDWNKIVACIQWATQKKADIINMSLGDMNEPPEIVHQAIQWASEKGIIVVAAAGNDPNSDQKNPTSMDVAYPARYDECISVAALDKSGNLAYFSNRGKVLDMLAPGVDIYSCFPPDKYAILSGSSQAAPMISGVCALLRAYIPEKTKNYKDMLFQLSQISNKNDAICKITSNYSIGVPSFSNIKIQSIDIPVESTVPDEIKEKLEAFDWEWKNGEFVSEVLS